MKSAGLADDIAHRHGVEHPVLHGIVAQHFGVADIVAVLRIAVDKDAENVLDSCTVTVEGGAAQLDTLAHLGVEPP